MTTEQDQADNPTSQAALSSLAGSRHTELQVTAGIPVATTLLSMDRPWVRQRLEGFLALCRAYDQHERSTGHTFDAKVAELHSQINGDIPTIREIVKRLDPELVEEINTPSSMTGATGTSQVIERALGILRDEEELKARLAPDAPSPIADRAGHAFISYVREDSHDVDRLQRTLEAAGVSVWRDTADLWPGEDWRAMIRRAITDNALVFIACFSSQSLSKRKSYQRAEFALAIEQLQLRQPDDPWLIPVRFDDCPVPDLDLGGGRTLGSIQRVDLFGDHRDVAVVRLMATVLRLLGGGSQDSGIERRTSAESSVAISGGHHPITQAEPEAGPKANKFVSAWDWVKALLIPDD